ncbi:hypothetical protein CA267_006480 [Alteromonas pelagimontana]|uniref:Lipoprotein n=1 Tax=Alteromonas pelagimontana TaxID=1858656 RepID=A0A6M4MBA5_9ALTE|nr:hypothetical protein [Alteromonas pelagimontana]QJR80443.1 hypothetical protein CA267_006480 [Alteromonas pelagimontana]
MKVILTALFICSLVGCSAFQSDSSESASKGDLKQQALKEIDVLACLDDGGVITKVCRLGMPACVKTFSDAGQSCKDHSECEGRCLRQSEFVDAGTITTGFCSQNNDPCGCSQPIVKGIAQPTICID